MADVTSSGFLLKTQNEYFEDERLLYLDIDPSWNLDPSTPDGLKMASDAEIFGVLDEALQAAYNSKDPNKARDLDLDIIGYLTGFKRSLGTPSTAVVILSGASGVVVEAGKLVRSKDGTEWSLDNEAVIGLSGTTTANITATTYGAIQADAGSINSIVDSVSGWQSVTNPSVATPGEAKQTNAETRKERALTVGRPGNNQVESTLGELGSVLKVNKYRAYENFTNAFDSNGLPPHSMAYIVDGGSDEDIAKAIYVKKNPGVALYGASNPVTLTVNSENHLLTSTDITFGRPNYIDMLVDVDITDDGSLPVNASELIKQAILDYSQGDLLDALIGFNPLGFNIGENVSPSRIYTPINKVIGKYGAAYVTRLEINSGTALIPISFDGLSRWTSENITVQIA